jgi:hypothetical protein
VQHPSQLTVPAGCVPAAQMLLLWGWLTASMGSHRRPAEERHEAGAQVRGGDGLISLDAFQLGEDDRAGVAHEMLRSYTTREPPQK